MTARFCVRALTAALLSTAMATAAGAGGDDFVIHDIWLAQSARGYSVQADLQVPANEALQNILQSGLEVRINFEIKFKRPREWWVDQDLGNIVWSPVISYDSISRRYIFFGGDERRQTFSTFEKALARAGRLRATPVAHDEFAHLLKDGVYILARLEMDYGNFPEPIKIDILTSEEWSFSSGWRRFAVRVK